MIEIGPAHCVPLLYCHCAGGGVETKVVIKGFLSDTTLPPRASPISLSLSLFFLAGALYFDSSTRSEGLKKGDVFPPTVLIRNFLREKEVGTARLTRSVEYIPIPGGREDFRATPPPQTPPPLFLLNSFCLLLERRPFDEQSKLAAGNFDETN